MKAPFYNRRSFLTTTGLGLAALGAQSAGLISPARAQAYAATQTMRGGSNNYRPNAPFVESLGAGFIVSGVVR
ncbi:MAG: twin-arginine translocation signal domain-containing protein, partial [Sulfitobacter sp.]